MLSHSSQQLYYCFCHYKKQEVIDTNSGHSSILQFHQHSLLAYMDCHFTRNITQSNPILDPEHLGCSQFQNQQKQNIYFYH